MEELVDRQLLQRVWLADHHHLRLRIRGTVYNAVHQMSFCSDPVAGTHETTQVHRLFDLHTTIGTLLTDENLHESFPQTLQDVITEIERDGSVSQLPMFECDENSASGDNSDDSDCSMPGEFNQSQAENVPPFDKLASFEDAPAREIIALTGWY